MEVILQSISSLVGIQEIASLLNVPIKTVYYWKSRHEIPFFKVGKHLRFNPAEVLRFFAQKTADSTPACVDDSKVLKPSPRSFSNRKGSLAPGKE